MKKVFLGFAFLCLTAISYAQTENHRLGLWIGGTIQHYNGNLGNSFFQFKTTCFAGAMFNAGYYLNRSFDVSLGGFVGDYGYCSTEADNKRIIAKELKCPGCPDDRGMGELRSRMTSGNLSVAYKFANGYLLSEKSKLSPYVYVGAGMSHLADNMKRNCVNKGNHFSVNGGIGIKYYVCERVSIGYNAGLSCFTRKKVYASNADLSGELAHDKDVIQMQKRKDLLLQNTLFVGINF